jgi:putative tricarboxylic transport membrane protein
MFWLAVGAFVLWSGRDLGLGKLNDPGSGFALFWVGVLTMALSSVVIFNSLRDPGPSLSSLWRDTRWGKVAVVVLLIVVYGFAFDRIGFPLATVVLLLTLMLWVDRVRLPAALTATFVATFGVWYVVTKGLKIQMPAGVLAPWLG